MASKITIQWLATLNISERLGQFGLALLFFVLGVIVNFAEIAPLAVLTTFTVTAVVKGTVEIGQAATFACLLITFSLLIASGVANVIYLSKLAGKNRKLAAITLALGGSIVWLFLGICFGLTWRVDGLTVPSRLIMCGFPISNAIGQACTAYAIVRKDATRQTISNLRRGLIILLFLAILSFLNCQPLILNMAKAISNVHF
jgi:hypothetical protein